MQKTLLTFVAALALIAAAFGPAHAAQFDVTITNITHASYFTPLLVTAHGGGTHLFQVGTAASEELQAMAECGDISGLSTQVGGADADTVENPAGGLLGPGVSTTASLNTNATGNGYLSITAMILPTNDGFVGLDALTIPTTAGTYEYVLFAYDAGTEANDELVIGGPCTTGVLGIPADPGGNEGTGGTGVTITEENTTVHIHRGVLGDQNPTGGESDLVSTIHRWLNPVAKMVIVVN